MKTLSLFIVITISATAAYSQILPNKSYKVGISRIFFGSGDMLGFNSYVEYNHKINRNLTVAPSVHLGYGSITSPTLKNADSTRVKYTKGSTALNLNVFASPMNFEKSKIRLGVGPSVRYIWGDTGRYVTNNGTVKTGNNFSLGYTLAIEGEFSLTNQWIVGLGGAIQSYASGERVLNFGLSTGYLLY